jgi:hypothetical protein
LASRVGGGLDLVRGLLHLGLEGRELAVEAGQARAGAGGVGIGDADEVRGRADIGRQRRFELGQGRFHGRVLGEFVIGLDVVLERRDVLGQVGANRLDVDAEGGIGGHDRAADVAAQGVVHHVGVHVQAKDAGRGFGAIQGRAQAEGHPQAGAGGRRAQQGGAGAGADNLLTQ